MTTRGRFGTGRAASGSGSSFWAGTSSLVPLFFFVASATLACATPAPRKPIEMEPIGTVPNVSRTVSEDEEATTTTPNSGTPNPLKQSACSGNSIESLDEVLRQCDVPMPKTAEIPSGMRDKLEVRVTPSTSSTTPGGRIELTVTFRNVSPDPLPLYFTGDPTPRFEVEAVDAKGKRADLPTGKAPPWPKGTNPPARDVKASRITLSSGGYAKVKIVWDAVKMRWAPEKAKTWEGRGYPRAGAGALAPGKYTLRFALPLIGVFEKGDFDLPKLLIEVAS